MSTLFSSKLGIDIGGVIINYINNAVDEEFARSGFSKIPPIEDALDSIRQLNQRFQGNVFLISTCRGYMIKNTQAWLSDNSFFEKTGIKQEHVYLCRLRRKKVEICEKIGVTHFVDDRKESLRTLRPVVPNRYHFSGGPLKQKCEGHGVVCLASWESALELIAP